MSEEQAIQEEGSSRVHREVEQLAQVCRQLNDLIDDEFPREGDQPDRFSVSFNDESAALTGYADLPAFIGEIDTTMDFESCRARALQHATELMLALLPRAGLLASVEVQPLRATLGQLREGARRFLKETKQVADGELTAVTGVW